MNKLSTLHTRPSSVNAVSERIVVTLALGLAVVWICWTSVNWFRYHPHLPWRDLFLVLTQVMELSRAPLDMTSLWQWFEPHYGTHRIAIPRLLLLLDTQLLSGQNHLFYAAAWLCLLLLVALYTRLAASYFREPRTVVFTAALASIWLFSPSHLWNLINAINVSWHLSLACSLLAFYLLIKRPAEPRLWDWCGAYLLCALAAFSTFAGVVAWLMLPLMACLIQPRAFIPTLLASGACAWLYVGGMASDASLASQWDAGTPDVIAKIRALAEAALAANTPARIMEKTLQFLGWPLSAQAPRLALILSLGSVAILAIVFASALLSSVRTRERLHPWFTFCLIAAGLCLGIALATQLGRLMVHPNHAHGPSYERYQTVVVVYWLSVSGLLMGQKPRTGVGGAVLFTALVGLAWALQLPTGDYLRQEIQSAEAAARLFNRGQLAHLHQSRPTAGNRFTPEFVFSFDAYFEQHQLAYRAPVASPAGLASAEPCDPESVKLEFATIQEIKEFAAGVEAQAVSASLTTPAARLSRAVVLYQGENLAGRLSPVHQGDYRPRSLLDPENTRWQGIAVPAGERDWTLVLQGATGASVLCKYTTLTTR
ncbi:MAG: hypothetical protein O7F73_06890 [Gammaproteobacteria bacterium]|nr:hypothetical protein [Gammaproteobacteria bacterium]